MTVKTDHNIHAVIIPRCFYLSILLFGASCTIEVSNHRSFQNPDQALDAFEEVVANGDPKALNKLFGPDSEAIYSSGDAIGDKNARDQFVKRFNEKHELEEEAKDRYALLVGNEQWPSPVPLVRFEDGQWYFDGAAGADEVANRRIGRNEIFIMDVCRQIAEAQKIYFKNHLGGEKRATYAQRLLSTPGKRDGLFWPRKPGEEPSPIGPLVAAASEEGYKGDGSAGAFHGYRFKLINKRNQKSLLAADGALTKGFVVLAYPAQWGVSGIMSFIITQDGILHQKNLGEQTEQQALTLDSFSDADQWQPVADKS